MTFIIHPDRYRIFRCEEGRWLVKDPELFFADDSQQDRDTDYGISEQAIVIELFRIACGKSGYYLANRKERKYYYCGPSLEDVRVQLLALGIGRQDPSS